MSAADRHRVGVPGRPILRQDRWGLLVGQEEEVRGAVLCHLRCHEVIHNLRALHLEILRRHLQEIPPLENRRKESLD